MVVGRAKGVHVDENLGEESEREPPEKGLLVEGNAEDEEGKGARVV